MRLTIFATSDTHGFIYPTNYIQKSEHSLPFGLARTSAVMKSITPDAENQVIKIDNGDFLQGSPFAYYVAKQISPSAPELLTKAYNHVGYDVGVLGNHEFNYGTDYLISTVSTLDYPILAANITDASMRPAFGPPFKIIEKGGIRIGVLGLTTSYIPHWENPNNINNLHFNDVIATAKEYIPILREQVDIVIVSYHGGFERDLITGEPTEPQTGENVGYELLKTVPGIDALITGHQHRQIATECFGVPVIQPGYRGEKVGKITLTIDTTQVKPVITKQQAELINSADYEPDAMIEALTEETETAVENWLDATLGTVEGDMTIKDPLAARINENAYIEFIQKVQMKATGVDISGTALFNNEGNGFGHIISMRDVMTNYIYPNTLVVEKITGADLKAALEKSANYFDLTEQGEIGVNPKYIKPKPQHYNYDMYEGIDYTIKVSKPKGSRIENLLYHNQPMDLAATYEVVVNQYRGVGGGNFAMFSADKIVRENQKDMTELIADYLHDNPAIKATANHNFKVEK